MTPWKAGLLGALLVAIVTAPMLRDARRSTRTFERENAALLVENRRIAVLERENRRLRDSQVDPAALSRQREEHDELLELRRQVERLQSELKAARTAKETEEAKVSPGSDSPPATRPSASPGWVLVAQSREVGADSPEHLLQSWIAALRSGDTNRMAALWDWPAEVPPLLGNEFLEAIAEVTANGPLAPVEPSDMMGFRVVDYTVRSDAEMDLRVDCALNDGSQSQVTYRVRRVEGEWRLAMGDDGLPLVVSGP